MKNFGPSAGQALQTRIVQGFHTFGSRQLSLSKHIIELHRSKTFDVQVGAVGFNFLNQFNKVSHVHFRVHATYNVHFGYGFAIVTFHNVQHLVNAQFPAVFAIFVQAAVAAKFAAEHAYVGRFNVKVSVEISDLPMQLLAYHIGHGA